MSFQGDSIYWVEVHKVVPNPFQPRREFDESKLQELADSIRMYGVLQPLTVTKKEIHREDGAFYSEYELIAGERRLRASKLAGLQQVPVIIRAGEDTEQEKLELAIIENLQREDLNAVDRALAFKQLADMFELSHSQVAKKVGRSREYVSNTIRLLLLPEYMLDSVKTGDLTEGHARSLLMLKERPEEQDVVYREILLKKLSVREVERITRKIATDKVRKKDWLNTDPVLIEIEKEFTDTLGTRVQISKTDFGGKLTIDYFSDDDLRTLLEIIKAQRPRLAEAASETEEYTDTLMQAPGAAVMAKLAQSTPLQPVTETPPAVSAPTVAPLAQTTPEYPAPAVEEDVFAPSSTHNAFASVSGLEPDSQPISSPQPSVPGPMSPAPPEPTLAPTQPEPPKPAVPIAPPDDEGEDLYSIRNFSV